MVVCILEERARRTRSSGYVVRPAGDLEPWLTRHSTDGTTQAAPQARAVERRNAFVPDSFQGQTL